MLAEAMFSGSFANRILLFDSEAAPIFAEIRIVRERAGEAVRIAVIR